MTAPGWHCFLRKWDVWFFISHIPFPLMPRVMWVKSTLSESFKFQGLLKFIVSSEYMEEPEGTTHEWNTGMFWEMLAALIVTLTPVCSQTRSYFEDHGKDKGHFPQWRKWFENIKSSGGSLKEPNPRLPTLRGTLSLESSGGEALCRYIWFFQFRSWCNRRGNAPDVSFKTGDLVEAYTVVKISPSGPESWAWARSICLSTSVFWNRIFV